ncbi:hypothetical protein OROGR_017964 [Orobanche gracilis]
MAAKTKYCTSRIKSFVIPLANYSIDADYFPVSFFEIRYMSWTRSLHTVSHDRVHIVCSDRVQRSCAETRSLHTVDMIVCSDRVQQSWAHALCNQLKRLLGNLKGMTSEYVASQCVLKLYSEGQVQLINKSEPRQLSQFAAHFVMNSTADHPQSCCNFATFLPMGEEAPLQRAEWIKFLGVFANLETRANQVFNAIKENYVCLNKASTSRTRSFKPIVAWMAYNGGVWSFTKDRYKLKYVEDSGGENMDDSINKVTYNISVPDDLDAFHAILCTIDVVIDETYTPDPLSYNASTFLQNLNLDDQYCFAFMANQSIWRYDKRIQSSTVLDWHDGAISQPHLVLADLIQALFPSENYNTTYFRNIVKGEGVVSIRPEMCDRDSFVPMEPLIIACE